MYTSASTPMYTPGAARIRCVVAGVRAALSDDPIIFVKFE
jgi:hypothetical protein